MNTRSMALIGLTAAAVGFALYLRHDVPAQATVAQTAAPVADDLPRFVELGSENCASCRAMIPVLDELRQTHEGELDVRFIDVWKDHAGAEAFGVRLIPTQVLLAPDGHELIRHTGFWSADAIRGAFTTAGYPLQSS